MSRLIGRGVLALGCMLMCGAAVNAEVGSLWELGVKLAGRDSHQMRSGNQQVAYTDFQPAGYYANQDISPSAYCSDCGSCGGFCDSGCYCESSCCCDPGCACEPGCYCESSCCCEPCCDTYGCCDCCSPCACTGGVYTQVDIMFLRAHVMEGPFGKLSEEYEFSPRVTFGAENGLGQGARARLWHYGHQLTTLGGTGGVRFEWNVLDLDLTKRFVFGRTDAVIGGGIRLASTEITSAGVTDEIDQIGLTLGADFETICFCRGSSYFSSVYGGRLSILGGDWERGGATLIRDDNIIVHELYAGVEFGCCQNGFDIFSQLKFEMQNWDSNYLASAPGVNGYSVGFVGPSVSFGAAY